MYSVRCLSIETSIKQGPVLAVQNVVTGSLQEVSLLFHLEAAIQYLPIQCSRQLCRTHLPQTMKTDCTKQSQICCSENLWKTGLK